MLFSLFNYPFIFFHQNVLIWCRGQNGAILLNFKKRKNKKQIKALIEDFQKQWYSLEYKLIAPR